MSLHSRIVIVAAGCLIAGCLQQPEGERPGFVRQIDWMERGVWLKVDTHVHTKFSDGSNTVSEVAAKAIEHGCHVIAIADHGDWNLSAAGPEYAEQIEVARRQFPSLIIIAGLEWNVPPAAGDLHATVLVPPGPDEFLNLQTLKEKFDDYERDPHERPNAADALRWLAEEVQVGDVAPVVILNHPGRKAKSSCELAAHIRQWRALNDVVVGFEGAPGHQKTAPFGSYQGEVELTDRWDPAVGVGDAWDELLAKGIDVWGAHTSSDFHSANIDYWPGEFSGTWLYAPDRTAEGVLKAFRAGSFFAAHGHIVRDAQLSVRAEGLPRPAYAGESIQLPKGAPATVRLDCQIPDRDWQGSANRLDGIELIAVTPQGARVLAVLAPESPQASLVETIEVPSEGVVLRARGRRREAGDGNLQFYTNPLRIEALPPIATAPAMGVDSRTILRRATGGLIAFLALCALASALRSRRRGIRIVGNRHGPNRQSHEGTNAAVLNVRAVGQSFDRPFSAVSPLSVPKRRHYAALAGFFIVLAIYGSLVPLNYRYLPLAEAVERFRAIPFLQLSIEHRADWVANILLFVPIGFCTLGMLQVDRRLSATMWAGQFLFVVAGCTALSVAIEFTQLWFPPRTVSQNDIVAETLGGFVGGAIWLWAGPALTNWVRLYTGSTEPRQRFHRMLDLYLAGLCVSSVMPLDLTINLAELYRKFEQGRIQLIPFSHAYGSWGEAAYLLTTTMLLFIPVGVWSATVLVRRGRQVRSNAGALLICFLVAAGIEAAQLLVYSRHTSSTDVLLGILGGGLGIVLARSWYGQMGSLAETACQRLHRNAAFWLFWAAAYSLFLTALFWAPYEWTNDSQVIKQALADFWCVPFSRLYWGTEYHAFMHILRQLLWFAPLGVVLAKAVACVPAAGRSRSVLLIVAAGGIISVSAFVELGQALLPSRYADITDVGLSSLGGLGGLLIAIQLFQLQQQPMNRPAKAGQSSL
jgi:glycopeptide antibiotics resistance protein